MGLASSRHPRLGVDDLLSVRGMTARAGLQGVRRGSQDGLRIQCPFHRAEFDIRTGEVHNWANFPPGIQLLNVVRSEKALKTYRAVVEDGEVVVDV